MSMDLAAQEDLKPRNSDFQQRTLDSFARQTFMTRLGAVIEDIGPGTVTIALDRTPDLCQQHGFFHGGVVGSVADNAGGYAAFTLLDAEDSILTVEYKLNLVAPADGDRLVACAQVVRGGRTLTVCRSDVYVLRQGTKKQCATMLGTFMALHGRPDHPTVAAA